MPDTECIVYRFRNYWSIADHVRILSRQSKFELGLHAELRVSWGQPDAALAVVAEMGKLEFATPPFVQHTLHVDVAVAEICNNIS
jgi:hypothetical protein